MGANLVPEMDDFSIHRESFDEDDHDVRDGIITPGDHKLLRFDFVTKNVGNKDFAIGSPEDHPDLFVWSLGHDHYHLKDFNEYVLLDENGDRAAVGYKQTFCLQDSFKVMDDARSEAQYTDCDDNQGISAGWADIYRKNIPGQYVNIDGIPDGDYTLVATTNAERVIREDRYSDNTTAVGLHIDGDTVEVIDLPSDQWA